jgi:hypothetical protein
VRLVSFGYAASMGNARNTYRSLAGKPHGKRALAQEEKYRGRKKTCDKKL